MRINEYSSLDEFKKQYIGEWNPAEGHWLGIDFIFDNQEWRMQTYPMYKSDCTLPDGREGIFGLYKKTPKDSQEYELLGEYATMEDLLDSKVICDKPFREVIMDDNTEIIGQD